MVNISDLIDFCFLHAPSGYAQDSNDQDYAKICAARGEVQTLLFSYNSHNSIFITLTPLTVQLTFDLQDKEIQMQPFIEFAHKLREYIGIHTE